MRRRADARRQLEADPGPFRARRQPEVGGRQLRQVRVVIDALLHRLGINRAGAGQGVLAPAADCHQGQLRDLMFKLAMLAPGVHPDRISSGVRAYMKAVVEFYDPTNAETNDNSFYLPAVIAGAISATEIMALDEFRSLFHTFHDFKLQKHIWFDHVTVEAEHTDEALALAEYFLASASAKKAVEYGFNGVLDANCHLYDGLMESTCF